MKNVIITRHAVEQYAKRFGGNRTELLGEVKYCLENGQVPHPHYPNGFLVDEEMTLVMVPAREDASKLVLRTVIYSDSSDERR